MYLSSSFSVDVDFQKYSNVIWSMQRNVVEFRCVLPTWKHVRFFYSTGEGLINIILLDFILVHKIDNNNVS